MAKKDLYETLGVKKDATTEEITKAYRDKAQKDHPDKGGEHDTFVALNKAHKVLIDPVKRRLYDETGESDLKTPEEEAPIALQEAIEIVLQDLAKGKLSINNINFIDEIKKVIDAHSNRKRQELASCNKQKRDISFLLSKTHLKNDSEVDYLKVGFDKRLSNLNLNINRIKRALELDKKVKEILARYDYDNPEEYKSLNFRMIYNNDPFRTVDSTVV